MLLLDLSLATAEENLALDEALLESAEAGGRPGECLRLWEPNRLTAVIGRSSELAIEVNQAACQERGVPILRRTSGGAAILTGPGCLMYAVVLSLDLRPRLRAIDEAHEIVLNTMIEAIRPLVPGVQRQGTSDLAIGSRKFSGNSLRVKRHHLLYHGTLLYDFPLELIGACLGQPPRQPEYRGGRSHGEFVANLPASAYALRHALAAAWKASQPPVDWPHELTAELVRQKYSQSEWNAKR